MKIYHNPRCSKSRETLQILEREESVSDLEVIEYLKEPPSFEELEEILGFLELEPIQLMRQKEDIYRELGIDDSWGREKAIRAMVENPKLIERPIVVSEGKAVIGRPPEAVMALV